MGMHPVSFFLALAFGISWALFALAKWGLGISSPLGWTVTSALFMFGPALAALIHRQWSGTPWRELGVVRTGIRWKWMGLAVLVPMAMPPLTLFFNWLLGDVLGMAAFGHTALTKGMALTVVEEQLAASGVASSGSMDLLAELPLNGVGILLIVLLAGALAGCTVNFVFAMGEELGWRGTLHHLTRRWGLWQHVLFTGLFWGLWHAPLVLSGHNYPDHPVAGVGFMCLLTTALALPLAWVRLRSRCVWSAGVFHGTVNGVAGASMLFTQGSSSLYGSAVGISTLLGLVLVGTVILLADRRFPREFSAA